MPFDTVIDKAQLESAITASANAIREKTGDTALIEWLSDKGFAEAIAAIEAGGISFAKGKFVPSEDVPTIEIAHNLGVAPDLLICSLNGSLATSGCVNYAMLMRGHLFEASTASNFLYYIIGGLSSSRYTVARETVNFANILTADTATIDFSAHTNMNFLAGKNYYWWAFASVI